MKAAPGMHTALRSQDRSSSEQMEASCPVLEPLLLPFDPGNETLILFLPPRPPDLSSGLTFLAFTLGLGLHPVRRLPLEKAPVSKASDDILEHATRICPPTLPELSACQTQLPPTAA